MISLKDIKGKVEEMIQISFPEFEILSRKGGEGVEVASFYIELDNLMKNNRLFNYERSMTIRIYIYPSNTMEGTTGVLEILEDLEGLFELSLRLQDRDIKILETSSKIVDGVFQFEFNINYFEEKEMTHNGELMQEMKFK